MTYEAPTRGEQGFCCQWIHFLHTSFLVFSDSGSCSLHTCSLSLPQLYSPPLSGSVLLFITPHISLSLPLNRALYDRTGEAEGDLSFKKDDILYVDESLPKGSFGTWMAWQLDENAQQIQRGQIPSKYMWVEKSTHAYTHIFLSWRTVWQQSVPYCCDVPSLPYVLMLSFLHSRQSHVVRLLYVSAGMHWCYFTKYTFFYDFVLLLGLKGQFQVTINS